MGHTQDGGDSKMGGTVVRYRLLGGRRTQDAIQFRSSIRTGAKSSVWVAEINIGHLGAARHPYRTAPRAPLLPCEIPSCVGWSILYHGQYNARREDTFIRTQRDAFTRHFRRIDPFHFYSLIRIFVLSFVGVVFPQRCV
jgi:hypothetical protein